LTGVQPKLVLRQLLLAVHFIHQQNVVHRDIKPDNVLITCHQGCEQIAQVYLTDFSLATRVGADQDLTQHCGSQPYLAPEILQRLAYKGGPSDIWALGVTFFACMFGRLPFSELDVRPNCSA
jgi:serine/threonine protein kinase